MKLKLLKFGAPWCGSCQMQSREFSETPIGIDIQEIDVDSSSSEDMKLVERYNIRSIPSMIIVDDTGEALKRFTGYTPSDEITRSVSEIEERNMGRFVVIEDFNSCISLVIDPDSGDTYVFDSYHEAKKEAKRCQNGKVVRL